MRKIPVYHIDAFTSEPFSGNPAGVVLEAEKLTENEMQKIANELSLPESAFLMPSEHPEADFKVRFFTPTEEINFCGHATVGLSWLLATEFDYLQKNDQVIFETNIGLIPVKWIMEDDQLVRVSMTQNAPSVKESQFDSQRMAELIGIDAKELDDRYLIKIGNTGNNHLLVPVKSRKAIESAEPMLKELAAMNREYQISTTHLFTFDTNEEFDVYTRGFGPGVGINEDPVTGSANGALAGYFYLEGIIAKNQKHQLKIGQGHAMGRPGTLFVTVTPKQESAIIEVAGSAIITINGNLVM
ncbi:PhzF family phenazine biosynthesis protein [Neobacillus sp. Marseille-QA0830]